MKCVELRPNADPDIAAWKLVEIASTIEPVQGDRIFSSSSTRRSCMSTRARLSEDRAGLDQAIANGWLTRHESGTYVRFTEAGAALFP